MEFWHLWTPVFRNVRFFLLHFYTPVSRHHRILAFLYIGIRNVIFLRFLYTRVQKRQNSDISVHWLPETIIFRFLYTGVQNCQNPDIPVHPCLEMSELSQFCAHWCPEMSESSDFCTLVSRNIRFLRFVHSCREMPES